MVKQRVILKKLKVADRTNDCLEKFEEHGIMSKLVRSNAWNENFEMLISYKEENGKLPLTEANGLGQWMANHRAILKKLKAAGGTNNRLEKFGEHGILNTWNETFEMIISYKEENGKLPPIEAKGMERWMAKQRAILKKLKAAGGANDCLEKFGEHCILIGRGD